MMLKHFAYASFAFSAAYASVTSSGGQIISGSDLTDVKDLIVEGYTTFITIRIRNEDVWSLPVSNGLEEGLEWYKAKIPCDQQFTPITRTSSGLRVTPNCKAAMITLDVREEYELLELATVKMTPKDVTGETTPEETLVCIKQTCLFTRVLWVRADLLLKLVQRGDATLERRKPSTLERRKSSTLERRKPRKPSTLERRKSSTFERRKPSTLERPKPIRRSTMRKVCSAPPCPTAAPTRKRFMQKSMSVYQKTDSRSFSESRTETQESRVWALSKHLGQEWNTVWSVEETTTAESADDLKKQGSL